MKTGDAQGNYVLIINAIGVSLKSTDFGSFITLTHSRDQKGVFPLKNSPPKDLSPDAKVWWRKLTNDYALDDQAARFLLETALQAFDRMHQARSLIDKHGAVNEDRFGQLRPNPACTIERDSRSAMLAALKALNLDLEPLRESVGRPVGRR